MNSTQKKELPNEILIKIFELSPRATVGQCISVCKAWSHAAIQMYYKHLCLNGDMISALKVMLSSSTRSSDPIMTVGHNGEYVKSLKIYDDKKQKDRLDKDQLIALLSNLPYLKKIDFSTSKRTMHYLDHLWSILRNPRSKDVIKGLEEVYVSTYEYIAKSKYLQICYALRDSLTHLCIGDLRQMYYDRQVNCAFISLLSQFTNLTHLHVHETVYTASRRTGHWNINNGRYYISLNGGKAKLSIQSVLDACSTLTHFKLQSIDPIIHDIANRSAFDAVLISADSGRSTEPSYGGYYYDDEKQYMFYNNCNERMKVLFLRVPNFNIRNFMDYISTQRISTMNLVLKQGFDIWILQEYEGAQDSLMREMDEKCCTIKNWDLKIGLSRWLFSPDTQAKLDSITLQDRIIVFQKFVDMIGRAHDDLICAMELDFYDEDEDKECYELGLTIKNGAMNVKYGFKLKENGYTVLPSILGGSGTDKKMQLSSKLYSISININKVSVVDDSKRKELQELANLMASSLITNCERLAFISIICGQKRPYYCNAIFRYKFSCKLYDSLQNDSVISTENYLKFVDRRSNSKDDSLSHFVVEGLDLSREVVYVLRSAAFLSHVKTIKLEKCAFAKDGFKNICLDLSAIQHIEGLVLDVSKLGLSGYQRVFFLIEYINKHGEDAMAYYQCHEKNRSWNKSLSLEPTTHKYIHSRNRFESKKSMAFTIKLSMIDTLTIYHAYSLNDNAEAEIQFDQD